MTSHRITRCAHCQAKYTFQASGAGCGDPGNDSRFCSDCWAAVQAALAAVPVRFERVWLPTTEVTLEELLEQERRLAEQQQGQLVARRVSFPLFNLQTGESDRSGFVRLDGKHYQYRFWPGREEEYSIQVEMERNRHTGFLQPW